MNSADMRSQSNASREQCLAGGKWTKVGRSTYQRESGEVVARCEAGWVIDQGTHAYTSCALAMLVVDQQHEPDQDRDASKWNANWPPFQY